MLPWYLTELNPDVYCDEALWLTLDFETTNHEKGSALVPENRVVLAADAAGNSAVAVQDFSRGFQSTREGLVSLRHGIEASRILVAHNAKFELQWLRRLGINTDHLLIFDTQIAEYVLSGNRRWKLSLDAVAPRYSMRGKERVIDTLLKGGVCPSQMPRSRLIDRVRNDVHTTREVAKAQIKILQEKNLLATVFTRCIVTPVLADMEMQGIALDERRVSDAYAAAKGNLAMVEEELEALSGGINLRSTKQLAELLYDKLGFRELTNRRGEPKRTASGKRATDADTLEKLKATTKAQRRFVELRKQWGKYNAAITKSLEFFRHVCQEDGGVLYGRYNQTVTQTHRLSSSGRKREFSDGFTAGCQFQNLPNEYKPLFKAYEDPHSKEPGAYVLVETDGSGIEFRVAAGIAQDPVAIRDIVTGADIHRYTASIIFNKPEEEITKEERREAKPDTFKPLYGGQSGTPEQQAYYAAFKEKYSAIAAMQAGWVSEVLNKKELVLPWGMRFYWPDITMTSGGYIPQTPQIYNYPIQSLATAEIVLIALTYLFWRIRAEGLRARLVNTVHDSAIAEVHKNDVPQYKEIAKQAFLSDVYRYLAEVYGYEWQNPPLGVGVVVADHWGEGEEEKYEETSPYLRAA